MERFCTIVIKINDEHPEHPHVRVDSDLEPGMLIALLEDIQLGLAAKIEEFKQTKNDN